MSRFLWVLQAILAFLYLAGGAYKVVSFDELALDFDVLSLGAWRALGVVEVLGGILLVVPVRVTRMPVLIPAVASLLAIETLCLAGLYSRYSLALTAANAMVWAVAMGLMAAFVAYARFKRLARA